MEFHSFDITVITIMIFGVKNFAVYVLIKCTIQVFIYPTAHATTIAMGWQWVAQKMTKPLL